MPLVEVTRNPQIIPDQTLASLLKALRPLIANALSTSQQPTKLEDVDIRARTMGRFEISDFDLQIVVSASYSEERNKDLSDRHQMLLNGVKKLGILPSGIKAYVWLVLPPAKFGECDL